MQVRAKEPLAYRNVRYEAGEEFTFYGEERDMTPAMEPVGRPMRKTKRASSENSEVFPVPETEA